MQATTAGKARWLNGHIHCKHPLLSRKAFVALASGVAFLVPCTAWAEDLQDLTRPGDTQSSHDRAVALDATYGLKGWNIPWPSFGETVTQDDGYWRTRLAQYGVSFLAVDFEIAARNLLDRPTSNNGTQAYFGQRFSLERTDAEYMNVDLSRWGVPNGQLQIAGVQYHDTMQHYIRNANELYRLVYYQTLLDGKLEVNAGYMAGASAFVGAFLAGQLYNPFGPSASIPVELGISGSGTVQPIVFGKYHFGNFYNILGVARSISPTAASDYNDIQVDPHQTRFHVPGENAVYVDELGYQVAASSENMSTWIRGGGIDNTSRFHNYRTNGSSTNAGGYFLADRQLTQIGGSGRGLYAGASVMYAPPQTNIYSQYYEARLYAKGAFDSRPKDTIAFVWAHNEVSRDFAGSINQTSATTGVFANNYTNSYTASYNVHVLSGVFVTLALSYTDHPSATWVPGEGHALNILASTYIAF
jgi:porin